MRRLRAVTAIGIAIGAVGSAASAQNTPALTEALLQPFSYRNLGPFRMGARVSDVAVPTVPAAAHNNTFYVAYWTGGVWKTTNNGTTFEPIFDRQGSFPVGDVTVAPSNG